MSTALVPQEIFLLERYSSSNYFAQMRDAWAGMVKHAEACLHAFERSLPLDYRRRPLPEQPDVIRGERVLVNFRATLAFLNDGHVELTHGDKLGLGYASNVLSDFKGFSHDYSPDWMDEPNVAKVIANGSETFWHWLHQATEKATNIKATRHAYWVTGILTNGYSVERGPLNPPLQWPTYRLNPKVQAVTGKPVPRSAIYLPDCADSCAALLIEGTEAPPASIGFDPKTTQRLGRADTRWTLVERVADSGGGTPGAADPIAAGVRLRCAAGIPCPSAGFWFTPARSDSRRRFNAGELMPDVGGDYGITIWQWDERQD